MRAYYRQDSGKLSKRAIVFVAILVFHAFIIWEFATGLAINGERLVATILQSNIIQIEKRQELPPPPPHMDLKVPPPVQVVAPDVTIVLPPIPALIHVVAPVPRAPEVIHIPPAPIVAASLIYQPDPDDYYPDASRRNSEEGRAVVHICVDTRGRVGQAEVAASSGYPMLDDAAVQFAKATRFKPATQRGRPVQWCTGYGVTFVLSGG